MHFIAKPKAIKLKLIHSFTNRLKERSKERTLKTKSRPKSLKSCMV